MAERSTRVSDWWLERLAAGELDANQTAQVKSRLEAEGRSLEDELARIRASNAQILADRPTRVVTASIRERARRRPRRFALVALPLVVSAAAALVIVARPAPRPAPEEVEVTRWKGTVEAPRLFVYRHGAGGGVRIADGARAARGDLLQLAYQVANPVHGVLLSIDGSGRVTVHVPESRAAAAPALRTGAEVRLGSAYELDAAPAYERFILVTSPEPFAVAPIVDAATRLAADSGRARTAWLPLPAGFAQTSVTLVKETP